VLEKDESFKRGKFYQDLSYHSNLMMSYPMYMKPNNLLSSLLGRYCAATRHATHLGLFLLLTVLGFSFVRAVVPCTVFCQVVLFFPPTHPFVIRVFSLPCLLVGPRFIILGNKLLSWPKTDSVVVVVLLAGGIKR